MCCGTKWYSCIACSLTYGANKILKLSHQIIVVYQIYHLLNNVIRSCLVDVEMETFGLDIKLKKAISQTKPKIVQIVHVYGHPAKNTKEIINFVKVKKS